MRSKKKPITFEEYLSKGTDKKTLLNDRHKVTLKEARGDENHEDELISSKTKTGSYSLKTRIKVNPWLKSGFPANKALSWLHQDVFKNPEVYRYNKLFLLQGNLFTFEYKNPKLKGTDRLPWFDKYPLVLSLGPVTTNQGIRNIGINLHLLPPKIRIVTVCIVFEIYKRLYRYQIFHKKQGPVAIRYHRILKPLMKYGIDFAVRMYVPQRMKHIVKFPVKEWHKAVFVPSRGYDSIKAPKLIDAWKKHVRKNHFSSNPNINWLTHV